MIIQLLGTIRSSVQFWDPDELKAVKAYKPIEESKCTIQLMDYDATSFINVSSSDHTFIAQR